MKSAAALFIFATEDGAILGWNPTVTATTAEVAVPNTDDAVYKGLAIASTSGGDRLYATDFHNGRVDVFDGSFTNVTTPGSFTDPRPPERLRAVRDSERRWEDRRHVRGAGWRSHTTTLRAGPRFRGHLRARAEHCSTASRRGPAELAVGHRVRAGRFRRPRRRSADRQLRRRTHQRVRRRRSATVVPADSARYGRRGSQGAGDRRALGASVREEHPEQRSGHDAVLHRRARRRKPRALRHDHVAAVWETRGPPTLAAARYERRGGSPFTGR